MYRAFHCIAAKDFIGNLLCRFKPVKNLSRTDRDQKGDDPGEEHDGRLCACADFKQDAVERVAEGLCAHGDREDDGDYLSDQVRRRFHLDKGHHLHRKNG